MLIIKQNQETKEASFPIGELSFNGAKIKVAGIGRPSFARAMQLRSEMEVDQSKRLLSLSDDESEAYQKMLNVIVGTYLIMGWDNIKTEDGSDFEYTTENLNTLINNPEVGAPILLAVYTFAHKLQREANEKKAELLKKQNGGSKKQTTQKRGAKSKQQ